MGVPGIGGLEEEPSEASASAVVKYKKCSRQLGVAGEETKLVGDAGDVRQCGKWWPGTLGTHDDRQQRRRPSTAIADAGTAGRRHKFVHRY